MITKRSNHIPMFTKNREEEHHEEVLPDASCNQNSCGVSTLQLTMIQ